MSAIVEKLDSGLTVVMDPMPEFESTAIGAWVRAGSRHERPEQHGLAHLLEHMAFKGTQKRSARQIVEDIENVGGTLNAATGFERTGYYARVLKQDIPLAVELLSDVVLNAVFDEGELEKEQQVVLQEIGEAHDQPDDYVFDCLQGVAWADQPLGRPILGTPGSVNAQTPAALDKFRSDFYRPDRMIVGAAGALEPDAFLQRVKDAFAGLEGVSIEESASPARRGGGENRASRELEQVHLLLGFQGWSVGDEALYAARVFCELLGGGMASRLFQSIREDLGLAYSVYSYLDIYRDAGLLGVYAGADEIRLPGLAPRIVEEVKKLADGPTEAETARARAQIKAALLMGRESAAARAEGAAAQLMAFGRTWSADEVRKRIDAVTPQAVADCARHALGGETLALAAVGPTDRLESFDALEAVRRG